MARSKHCLEVALKWCIAHMQKGWPDLVLHSYGDAYYRLSRRLTEMRKERNGVRQHDS